MKVCFGKIALLLGFLALSFGGYVLAQANKDNTPLRPTEIAVCGDNILISGMDNALLVIDKGSNTVKNKIKTDLPVTGVLCAGGNVYITTSYDKGYLSLVDLSSGIVSKSVEVGMGAISPVASEDGKTIYVCNQYKGTISRVDASLMSVTGEVKVLREPSSAVISKDGKYLFVNNHLPAQAANLDIVAADLSVIDLGTFTKTTDIKLSNGSNALRGITLSPDGKYVFVTHNLGRFQVPTSQLQQGWMNTSAMSVVDANTHQFLGSVLFDEPERGAAGIWGVKCSGDKIVVSHSGTHDVSIVNYEDFKRKFEAYKNKENLSYDLHFLYGMRDRVPMEGNGPRSLTIDDNKAYVTTYFSDTLNVVNLNNNNSIETIVYNPNRMETNIDLGEKYFNDATYCFQNWQSCNGCHPGDARTDGMNWDLMNDGIGNSKNCKSLLYSHVTPPSMISGIRVDAETAVRKGFQHIQFTNIPEELCVIVDEYLKSLKHLPSPYLVNGQLSDNAKKGREIFEKYKCDECHSGPYFTDQQMHVIGENVEFEKGWDTPTLIEVWRTAPYLFDGRAATLNDMFEVHKHGINGKVNKKEIDLLVEYVNSL